MIEYYVWLNEMAGISTRCKREWIHLFVDPKCVFESTIHDWPEKFRTNKKNMDSVNNKNLDATHRILEENEKRKIKIMTIGESIYRSEAVSNESTPLLLYYKGSIENQMKKTIAVIGSRKSTEYGKVVTKMICEEYVKKQTIIISGLATGIDHIAHQTTLDLDGKTYAFAACGLDTCYPTENESLMREIEERGAVISAYPAGTPPRRYQFIQRNELMTMWSDEVIVVEAATISGAVKTAEFALKNNQRVYVVPNNIFVLSSEGCNDLLDKGALPYRCGKQTARKQNHKHRYENLKNPVLENLKVMPMSIVELADKTKFSIEYLQNDLLMLELSNQVSFQQSGKWHYIGYL